MKLEKIRIVIGDSNEQELAYYTTLCRKICEKQEMLAEIKTYVNSNELLYDMGNSSFLPLVSILLIKPEDGFEMAPVIARKRNFDGLILYFSSALDHCLQAFDIGAYNYLLKGADQESLNRFYMVFQKALKAASQLHRQYLVLSCAGEYKQIDINEIYYFKGATSRMISVEYEGGSFQFVSTLQALEERLRDRGFIRVHRSWLVSARAVRVLNSSELTLSNGEKIPITRNYTELKAELGNWLVQRDL